MKKTFFSFIILVLLFITAGCTVNSNNAELEKQIADLQQQVTDLNNQVTQLQNEKKSLEERNAELENELKLTKEKLSKYETAYSIEVIDIDGEILGGKVFTVNEFDTVWEALKENFVVSYTESEYGPYISSINNSVVDNNYYISIYENGVAASTGVEGLVIDNNDEFKFVVECWNTVSSGYGVLDEIDVLVDKAIYYYAKNYMVDYLSSQTSYTGSSYWTFMALNLMIQNGYDQNVFNVNSVSEEFINNLNSVDVTTLSGANIGKYYYTARLLKEDLSEFKTFYQDYITNTISTNYSEWTTPFIASPAYSLELESEKLSTLINTEYLAGTAWGADGISWQVASLQLYNKYDEQILSNFPTKDYNGGTSTAIVLLPYAALNVNVRNAEFEVDGLDLIEILMNTYYDEELTLVKYATTDTGVNMSTNQIYAGLMAYKVQRDLGIAANIFA